MSRGTTAPAVGLELGSGPRLAVRALAMVDTGLSTAFRSGHADCGMVSAGLLPGAAG